MPVVSMMSVHGDPDKLAQQLREELEPVARRLAPKHGGLGHIVARTDDGLLIINLWKSEEGRHSMAEEPEVRKAVRAAGLPPPAFEGFEMIDYEFAPELHDDRQLRPPSGISA